MFNFFASTGKPGPVKGFKVSLNSDRSKKYGIAANSFGAMKQKISAKFNLEVFDLFSSDGSLIDDEDYFLSLPAQSLLIVAEEGEDVKTGRLATKI
jgi:DNA fragmentation factor, 40 kD, beta subunit